MDWMAAIGWGSPWFWLGLGLVFIVVEILVSGEFFLWFGIAAWLTAPLAWFGLAVEGQVAAFAVFSVLAVVVFVWRWRRREAEQGRDGGELLNDRLRSLIGQIGKAKNAIPAGGRGEIALGDGLWTATADTPIPKGARVRVCGVRGMLLVVEPLA